MRSLARENSELKAAKLMNLFPGGSQPKPSQTSSQTDRLVESLKVQLSEKTNDYLRIKEENERLKEHLERHDSQK
jgi:molecular chaperone GrpE (heat shock protein)